MAKLPVKNNGSLSSHVSHLSHQQLVLKTCCLFCSAATGVILEGAQWPLSDFEDSGGITSGRWEKLSPGATVRAEYFITPKTSGPYPALAAKVLYKADAGGKPQVNKSCSLV